RRRLGPLRQELDRPRHLGSGRDPRGGRGDLLPVLNQPSPTRPESNRSGSPGRRRTILDAPEFAPDVRRTYSYHRAFSALSGLVAGMLANGPTIGIKALRAADWHLALPMSLSGIGLVLRLAVGAWMARRPKLPFVIVRGFASCGACLGMALAPDPLDFLFLLGLFHLLDSISRPAIAAIIRLTYPAESRGWVTGHLR